MNIIYVIKSCSTVQEIEVLGWAFDFDERHREAALWQRIILWAINMERGLEIERCGVCPELLTSWTEQQREWFYNDWNDDSFLTGMEDPTIEVFEPLDEPLEEAAIQTGEGSRKLKQAHLKVRNLKLLHYLQLSQSSKSRSKSLRLRGLITKSSSTIYKCETYLMS